MNTVRLSRVVYSADEYGNSTPIPKPDDGVNRGAHIVGVDWSTPGEVAVTWMRPA